MAEIEAHDEVVEWLDSLNDADWHRVAVVVDRLAVQGSSVAQSMTKENKMANYSRWDDGKKRKGEPSADDRAGVEQDLALGQLIYDLRTEAALSQRELAERMGTTQSVISRLEEGGGARNRIDTLARVATALNRHLVLSFPTEVPEKLTDAVQVA